MSGLVSGVNENVPVKNDQEKYDVKLGIRKWKHYPEYKDSGVEWIGEIPKEWNIKPLKRIVENVIIKGVGKKLPFIALEHIVSGTGQLIEGFELQTVKADDYAVFTKGDILFGKLRPYLRKYYIADVEGCCPTELLVLRSSEEEIHNKYLFYMVESLSFVYLTDSTSYGVKMPRTSWDKISQEYFMIPTLLEQRTITNFLDVETSKIDILIEKKQRLIELLEEKRSALISHAVTKGFDPDVKMKDSGVDWIGGIPDHWTVNKIKYLCSVNGRIGFRGYTVQDLVSENEGALTLGATQIDKNGNIDLSSPVYISWKKYYESPEIMVKIGNVLIVQRGSTCGKIGIVKEEIGSATINPSLTLLKNSNSIMSKYLFYYLSNPIVQSIFNLFLSSTAIPMLSQEQISNIPVLLPESNEQIKIANFLDRETQKIDTFINKISAQIEKLKEYRTALISAAVTGKIDVREEVA